MWCEWVHLLIISHPHPSGEKRAWEDLQHQLGRGETRTVVRIISDRGKMKKGGWDDEFVAKEKWWVEKKRDDEKEGQEGKNWRITMLFDRSRQRKHSSPVSLPSLKKKNEDALISNSPLSLSLSAPMESRCMTWVSVVCEFASDFLRKRHLSMDRIEILDCLSWVNVEKFLVSPLPRPRDLTWKRWNFAFSQRSYVFSWEGWRWREREREEAQVIFHLH